MQINVLSSVIQLWRRLLQLLPHYMNCEKTHRLTLDERTATESEYGLLSPYHSTVPDEMMHKFYDELGVTPQSTLSKIRKMVTRSIQFFP